MKDFGHLCDETDATTSTAAKVDALTRCFVGHLLPRHRGHSYTASHGSNDDPPVTPPDSHAEIVVSTHAAEALEDDNLSILDLENIVLTGQIAERQRDTQTHEVKCVVAGVVLDGAPGEAVVKIGFTGKLVVITVYLC